MEPNDLLQLIRRRLTLILVLTTLGLTIAVLVTSKIVPMYESTATVFVSTPPAINDPMQGSGNELGDLNTGNNFTQARIKSYATIVNNRSTLQPVIDELGLKISVEELAPKISATTPNDTVLMFISAKNEDPVLAAKIANSVAKNFADTVLSIELNSTIDLSQLIKLSTVRESVPNFVPVSPRKNFNYFLGLFLGGILAFTIALFLKFLDKSLKSEKDLGTTDLLGVVAYDSQAIDKPLIKQLGTYDVRTEAFRVFRTNLLHALDEKEENCIAVSSCFSGEGKTTATLNLGYSIAQAGFSVVIVEADMRRPGIMKYLRLEKPDAHPHKSGLSELLFTDSNVTMKRKMRVATIDFPDSQLDIILSGEIPENPAELLGNNRFIELIEELKSTYDYVIVDTPPILAVADAAIISRVTRNIVLILHAGQTSKRNFEAARESIAAIGIVLLGALLNKVPKHKAGEHYGYTYSDSKMAYYRYSYNYSPKDEPEEQEKKSINFPKINFVKFKKQLDVKTVSPKYKEPEAAESTFEEFLRKNNFN
jgi:non-specific protein-tyrosine kinase